MITNFKEEMRRTSFTDLIEEKIDAYTEGELENERVNDVIDEVIKKNDFLTNENRQVIEDCFLDKFYNLSIEIFPGAGKVFVLIEKEL